jgi:release factor glutamine methyltransferase
LKSQEWFKGAVKALRNAGISSPEKEAQEMLSALGINPVELFKRNPVLNQDELKKLTEYLERRKKREPLQYILGYTYFLDLKIKTERGVLIPRPETELLVLEVIREISSFPSGTRPDLILDLCTGTGAIALSIGSFLKDSLVYGVDISEKAISIAKENAELNGIKNVIFLQGDLFEPFKGKDMQFDIITANPPYIKTDDINDLEPEVRDWEPLEALNGGKDGLQFYRRIITDAPKYLKNGGLLFLELGAGLYKEVISLAKLNRFTEISIVKDLNGIERILKGKFKGVEDEGSYPYWK